jgi:hypothetical protein
MSATEVPGLKTRSCGAKISASGRSAGMWSLRNTANEATPSAPNLAYQSAGMGWDVQAVHPPSASLFLLTRLKLTADEKVSQTQRK